MRICLIGNYSSSPDDSHQVSTGRLADNLGKSNKVLPLSVGAVRRLSFWKEIRSFHPEIIHYVPGASLNSFLLVKLLSIYVRNTATVVSVGRPYFSNTSARFLRFVKPDLALVQSGVTDHRLQNLGFRTRFLPGGVDVDKFIPVAAETKLALREKYGLDTGKPVLLHVGSVKVGRGVLALAEVQRSCPDVQVLILGPTSVGFSQETKSALETAGCLVRMGYIKDINEMYALSDMYLYPTVVLKDSAGRDIADSAEAPLSVFEAMSCNLPIVASRFGALPSMFTEGDGFYFAEPGEFSKCVRTILSGGQEIKTRERILPYSWPNISKQLESIYCTLLSRYKNQ